MPEYDYDVAFSFAGEDRRIAESLANQLKQQNVSVFYDRDVQAQTWGENLQEYLTEVYLKQARFCVMLISQACAQKMWTR
ncbi:MAG: TIR domain-containing protein, partial [Verrucomicrobiota bacterium]